MNHRNPEEVNFKIYSNSYDPNQRQNKEAQNYKEQEYTIKKEEIGQQTDSQQNNSSEDKNEIIKKSKKSTKTFRFHSKSSKCYLCGKQLSDRFILYNHLKQIHDVKPHGCKKCEQSFDTVKDLKHHIKTEHFKMTEKQLKIADQGKKYIKAKVPNVTKYLQKETEEYLSKFQKSNQGEQQYLQQNNQQRQLRRKTPPVQKNNVQGNKYKEEDEEKDSSNNNTNTNNSNNNRSTSEYSCHAETGSSEDQKKKKKQNQKTKELLSQQLHQQHHHQHQHKQHRMNNHQLQAQKECKIKIIDSNTFAFSRNSLKLTSDTSTKDSNRIGIVLQSSDNNNSNNSNSNNSNNSNSNNSNNEDSSNQNSVEHYKIIKENKSTVQILNQLKCMKDTCKYHNQNSTGMCEGHRIFQKRLKIQQDYSHYCQYFLPGIDEEILDN